MIQSIDEQIAFKYSLLLYHLFEYNLLYNLFIIYYIFIYWKRIVNLQKLFQRGDLFFKFKSSSSKVAQRRQIVHLRYSTVHTMITLSQSRWEMRNVELRANLLRQSAMGT